MIPSVRTKLGILSAVVLFALCAFISPEWIDFRRPMSPELVGDPRDHVANLSPSLGHFISRNGLDFFELPPEIALERIDSALDQIQILQNTLTQKYGANASLSLFNGTSFYGTSEEFLQARFLIKIARSASINFGFMGTSITAAHDIYFQDGYVTVFGKLLKPIFDALEDVQVQSMNLARGNNDPLPYNFCLKTIAGLDVDVISWEQFVVCRQETNQCIDVFLRNAISLPSRPALLILDTDPNITRVADLNDKTKLFYEGPGGVDLRTLYQEFPIHSYFALQSLQNVPMFDAETGRHYDDSRMYLEGKPFEYKHPLHPGPYGHELIAESMAFSYASIIAKSLLQLRELLSFANDQDLLTFKLKIREILKAANYDPLAVPPLLYTDFKAQSFLTKADQTKCATIYEPFVLKEYDLLNFVRSPADLVDHRPIVTEHETQEWEVAVADGDVNAVRGIYRGNKGYLDIKWTLSASRNASSPLEFEITVSVENSYVLLCSLQKSGHYKARTLPPLVADFQDLYDDGDGNQGPGAAVAVDGDAVSLSPVHASTCVLVEKMMTVGNHVITVTPLLTNRRIAVTHLVWQ